MSRNLNRRGFLFSLIAMPFCRPKPTVVGDVRPYQAFLEHLKRHGVVTLPAREFSWKVVMKPCHFGDVAGRAIPCSPRVK